MACYRIVNTALCFSLFRKNGGWFSLNEIMLGTKGLFFAGVTIVEFCEMNCVPLSFSY